MVTCPFEQCEREFQCTGGARDHLQVEHGIDCNRLNVWDILRGIGADVPRSYHSMKEVVDLEHGKDN